MILIFEGLDKTGKGTIETEVLRMLNYKPIIMDRGPAGYQVFNEFFNRNHEESYEEEFKLVKNTNLFKVIYLYCDENEFYNRINKNNERILYDYSDLENKYRKKIYEKYPNPIIVNTSLCSIQESAKKIIEAIKND